MELKRSRETRYRTEDIVADLIFIFEAFIKFFIGIQALKSNSNVKLLDNFDCWTWPFFREAFGLLDAIMTPGRLLNNLNDKMSFLRLPSSSTSSSASVSVYDQWSSGFITASASYKSFRLMGNVQDLKACAGTLHFTSLTIRPPVCIP